MDYKELLVKYIALIAAEEGITYIHRIGSAQNRHIPFTQTEIEELKRLSDTSGEYN